MSLKISHEELIELMRKQRELELYMVTSLSSLIDKVENQIVKLLLHGIVLDSTKHADILDALVVLTKTSSFGPIEKYEVGEGVKKHIEVEREMLQRINEIIARTDDAKTKTILNQIALEEERHHRSLLELDDMIQGTEKPSEIDWWDYMNRWSNFSA